MIQVYRPGFTRSGKNAYKYPLNFLKWWSSLVLTAQCTYVCSKANRVLGTPSGELWCIEVRTFLNKAVQELGEAALGVLRVGLVTALCEGSSGKPCWKSWVQHQVYENGARGWRAWSMEGDWKGWICWHWRREETVLIWSNCLKISKGLSAIPWNSFRVDSSERTRGHSKKLIKGSFRRDIRKYFFSQRVVSQMERSEWGGGSGHTTVEAFKKKLEDLRKTKKDLLMD